MNESRKPQNIGDTQSSLSPYEIPKKIWSLLESYFEKKYKVELVEDFPRKEVITPVISWRIYRRDPGSPTKASAMGEKFSHTLRQTPEGYTVEAYVQEFEVIYEYNVFAPLSAQADEIAWDLERAILKTAGPIQEELPRFALVFLEQVADSSLQWRMQEVVPMRTLRFKCRLPVEYELSAPTLRSIELEERYGRTQESEEFTRTTNAIEFYVTDIYPDRKVVSIPAVSIITDGVETFLEEGVDYYLRVDRRTTANLAYIEWNDTYGNTPTVGSTFYLTYNYVSTTHINKLLE